MELGNLWQIQQIMLKATQPDSLGRPSPGPRRSFNPAASNCLYRACFENAAVRRGWGDGECAWAQGHYRGWKCTVAVAG